MDKPKTNLDFRLMSMTYKIRDFFSPRIYILRAVGIKSGFTVLDYGCGPGSYIIPIEQMVGQSGKVYALDIHPLAIKSVKAIASKRQFTNVETILSDCKTGLPDSSVDVVLLYDIFHDLGNPNAVLTELHRVLKPTGFISLSDHHLKENDIETGLTGSGLFKLSGKNKKTYSFGKTESHK
jgi:ubiquinone/menaquinone biosynthesis C-methylase UbiE